MSEEYKCQRCLQNVVIVNETACSHVVKVTSNRDLAYPRETREIPDEEKKRALKEKVLARWQQNG